VTRCLSQAGDPMRPSKTSNPIMAGLRGRRAL